MLVSEAVKNGILKLDVRIRTNANLDRADNTYFTGVITYIGNTEMHIKRDDKEPAFSSYWLICLCNTKATIEILKDKDKKENKDMSTGQEIIDNTDLLEDQFEEEKLKDVKIIVKHCSKNLSSILLKMLLKNKAEDIKTYAIDLEKKEIAEAKSKSL